jgi:hypothetical protein
MGEVGENLNIFIISSLTLDDEGKMGIYSPLSPTHNHQSHGLRKGYMGYNPTHY